MLQIFYKMDGQIEVATEITAYADIKRENVLWIDLYNPSGDEKHQTEAFLGTEIQSRAQAEEIESSSRFYETDAAIFANTNFLIPGPEEYTMETVSIVISSRHNILTTIRESPLRSFTDLQRRMMFYPSRYPDGFIVFSSILEQRVDLDADMIELMAREIEQFNKKVSMEVDIDNEFLLDINQLQENLMLVRENVVDKQRVLSALLKSSKCPNDIIKKMHIILKDISSLINHTNFNFERLEYLQNTAIGLINLEQNKIMKVFTLVSLLLMPPTLITGFYGMNVELPVIGKWADCLIIFLLMVVSIGVTLIIFKKRKML